MARPNNFYYSSKYFLKPRTGFELSFIIPIAAARRTIPTNNRNRKTRAAEIHKGDKTHNQDQAITPVSLRIMKIIVKVPAKPIPPELFLRLL